MVLALGIDEERPVLTDGHRLAFASRIPGGHGVAQIVRAISPVIRDVERLRIRYHLRIFRHLQRELLVRDHRLCVGAFDGDVDRVRNGTVLLLLAIIHGDLQVEFLFFPLRQAVSDIFIGREGIAAVLIQRERAQDLSVLLDRIGRGTVFSHHFVCQRDVPGLFDTVCEGLRSIFRNFLIAYVLLIRVRGPDPAFSDTARILDLKIFDRLDDRLVIDALDSHRDRESLMFPDPYLKVQRDRGVFIQLLDSLAAVIEHEAVAPLAIFALFQDQRAEVGLDHMRLIAVSVRQPDLIGRDVYRGSILGFQREGAAFHMRRQGDIVLAVVFCHFRHRFRLLELYRVTAPFTPLPVYIKDDLLLVIRTVRVLHPDGEGFLAGSALLKPLIRFAERIHHIGVLAGHGIDGQVAVCALDGLQGTGLLHTALPGLTTGVLAVAHAVAQLGLLIRFPYIINVLTVGLAFDRIPAIDPDRSIHRHLCPSVVLQLQRRGVVLARDGDGDGALCGHAVGGSADSEVFRQGVAHVQLLTLHVGGLMPFRGIQLVGILQLTPLTGDGQDAVLAADGPSPIRRTPQVSETSFRSIGGNLRDFRSIIAIKIKYLDGLLIRRCLTIFRNDHAAVFDDRLIIRARDGEGQVFFFRDGIVLVNSDHREGHFEVLAIFQVLDLVVVEDKGIAAVFLQRQITVLAIQRAQIGYLAALSFDLDEVLENVTFSLITSVRAVHVRRGDRTFDFRHPAVFFKAFDRKSVAHDLQPGRYARSIQ